MDQRWKRLPLLVIILLFWRNADGFKGGAYSSAHHGWGQPSDAFSPRAVQSSMSEINLTGILPVEEVGSSLFPNNPLKSKSKLNLLQFVKGGSSSYQSTSHAQTAPSSSVSASLTLSLNQQPSSSLASSGSTIPGVAGGLSLETQYAASGLGQVVSTLGERISYPAKLGVSGQSTSDTLHVSSSQETAVQLAETSLPVFSKKKCLTAVHLLQVPLPLLGVALHYFQKAWFNLYLLRVKLVTVVCLKVPLIRIPQTQYHAWFSHF
ncbi:uncharacterized protein LOC107720702 isoform X1 [Sinocyclocheilus rhinocerous]|uniref:uncharacterized protein LOC107720702 isoform X1 n=1 Tax=Sinocyclocheilus rhinocerous TaxID=307959 RepID=UPI0007B826DC|nr:PREDICTED: uncharacterized protein LOC107720702 isoform X1 [Sinocyclocheilus rhinocerous]